MTGSVDTHPHDGPRCFLHIPKSAGTSLRAALEVRFGSNAVSPRRCDTYGFVDFDDYDALARGSRELIVVADDEIDALADYSVVTGHFRLETLLAVSTPERIGTILREPRARLLSLYAFGLALPAQASQWSPYPEERSPAAHAYRPIEEFLAEPLIAADTDNVVCRMLLDGSAVVPELAFFTPESVPALATAAAARLDRLGLAGVLELGNEMWQGLSRLFGAELSPGHANATEDVADPARPASAPVRVTQSALELLEQRTAADRLVYAHALARNGVEAGRAAELICDAAFADQLVRLGAVQRPRRESALQQRIVELETELTETRTDLARHQGWLGDLERSASWQVTAPLRSAKRRAQGRRSTRTVGR